MCPLRSGVSEPKKHLGHGIVDNASSSVTMNVSTSAAQSIFDESLELFRKLTKELRPEDLRGLGIHVSKLRLLSENPSFSSPQVGEKPISFIV